MGGLPSLSFVAKFKAKVPDFIGGRKLLQRLEQKTCGLDFILVFLEMYCGVQVEGTGARAELKTLRSRNMRLASKVKKLAKRLANLAKEVEQINREPIVTQQMAQHGTQPFMLADDIRSYLSHLANVSEELRDLSLRNSPMGSLLVIENCMRGSSGKVDRKDLALLLEIGYAACGVKKILSPNDLSHLLCRAREEKQLRIEATPINPPKLIRPL